MNASTEIAELERALIWATNPQKLLKFGNAGNPKFREFSLSGDLKSLVWNSKSKREKTQSRVVIDSIREIVFGQRTEKFLRHRRVDLEHLSFSLVFETTAPSGAKLIDSLDVIAKDEKEFRKWTAVLIALTGKRVPNDVMARVQDVVRAMRPDQCDEIGNESRIENEKSFFPYPLKKSIANSPFIKRIPARVTITNKFKDKPQLSDESRDFQSAFHRKKEI